jgi:hypothetical protein
MKSGRLCKEPRALLAELCIKNNDPIVLIARKNPAEKQVEVIRQNYDEAQETKARFQQAFYKKALFSTWKNASEETQECFVAWLGDQGRPGLEPGRPHPIISIKDAAERVGLLYIEGLAVAAEKAGIPYADALAVGDRERERAQGGEPNYTLGHIESAVGIIATAIDPDIEVRLAYKLEEIIDGGHAVTFVRALVERLLSAGAAPVAAE